MDEMSVAQWESLCDGCGKCCCLRMEDEDNGNVYTTDISCKLLDTKTCLCSDYDNRKSIVPDCVKLTPKTAPRTPWLPATCAYRLVAEGKPLFDWHHLISGSRETVHERGMSVKDAVVSEILIPEKDHIKHIVYWPGEPEYE